MARPKFVIDYELVEKLATSWCTQEEIASILGCHVKTLQRDEKFSTIYKRGLDQGKASLRREQWKAAKGGNATMLIWLGKQYLGQRDKPKDEDENQVVKELVEAMTANAAAIVQSQTSEGSA